LIIYWFTLTPDAKDHTISYRQQFLSLQHRGHLSISKPAFQKSKRSDLFHCPSSNCAISGYSPQFGELEVGLFVVFKECLLILQGTQ
jgi:hypothetical protein